MSHDYALERLDDFASGELPDLDRVRVQRHLDECDECRTELESIRTLLALTAELPASIAPRRDLWAGIAGRLEPRDNVIELPREETKVIPLTPRRRPWQPPRWALQAAAAVVLIASSSAITAVLMHRQGAAPLGPVAVGSPVRATPPATATTRPMPDAVPVENAGTPAGGSTAAPAAAGNGQTALAAFRPAEKDYEQAIGELKQVLETKRGRMAPETVQTLETNLRIIDAAISESRAALERDPNSRELTRMLTATYDAKVKLLRQAVEL
jgi:anti-sigma factor RsiW